MGRLLCWLSPHEPLFSFAEPSRGPMDLLYDTLFNGLAIGSVLVLAALGLAVVFGLMGVINMAHGELMMIGAYTTSLLQLLMPNNIDYSLFVAIPSAFVVS